MDEGATVAVKVKLSKAPGSETVIRIDRDQPGGATTADYTGVPQNVTFDSGGHRENHHICGHRRPVDDDGEKVELSFGSLPGGITATAGEAAEAVVTITDDDKPTALTVPDRPPTPPPRATPSVKVTLSDDPEMDLTIPISKTRAGPPPPTTRACRRA